MDTVSIQITYRDTKLFRVRHLFFFFLLSSWRFFFPTETMLYFHYRTNDERESGKFI